jgi:hypothetical protein
MRRLVGRHGKGGGHGRTAGGWIDAAKVPPGERRAVQREVAARLARELRKDPGKMVKVALEAGRGNGGGG